LIAGKNEKNLFEGAIDLTHELANGMPVYPGDPVPSFKRTKTVAHDGVNLSDLNLGSHTGTHFDAPRHFFEDGVPVDKIPVKDFISDALVLDLSFKRMGDGISSEDLRKAISSTGSELKAGDSVILYTGCSDLWGKDPAVNSNFTYLSGEGAKYLVSKKVKAVGIDFLSIEQFHSKTHETHKELLGNGVYIVESLNRELKKILGKRVLFMFFPLKFENGDGAPCRALAVPLS
jgi:arylformamidase